MKFIAKSFVLFFSLKVRLKGIALMRRQIP